MADAEYKRLGCASIGCNGEHKAKGLCATHYMRLKRTGSIDNFSLSCAHCGSQFEAQKASFMYCSNDCKLAAWKVKHGIVNKTAKVTEPQKALKSLASAIKRVARAKRQSELLASKRKIEEAANRTNNPCVVCGGDCGYVFGRAKTYCSKECRQSTEAFKDAKKAQKSKRKALMRGVHAETFAPNRVFERDGWRCQICGVSTPKSRRGTMHANAPELDHIQPLSKGGQHTKSNTQCACRACNGWKSDRVVVGQVGLFSSLIAA